jgi:hypothetical protein
VGTGLLIVLVVGVVAAVATVAGVLSDRSEGLDGHAARRASLRRELMQVPATPIAAVKHGDRVRIQGQVLARGPLRTSPVSEQACVGFCLTVDAGHQSPSQRVLEQEEFDSIVIADGTGEAVLHAPFRLELDPYDARSENVPQTVVDLVKQTGANITMFGVLDQLFCVEIVLRPGDEIIAVGRATVEIDPAGRAPSHREPPVTCHLDGTVEPVVIADADPAA